MKKEEKELTEETSIEIKPDEKPVKNNKNSHKVFFIIISAILIVGLMLCAFLLGKQYANKEQKTNDKVETNQGKSEENLDKEKYKYTSYVYKNSDGYYCGNQNDICTEKGIEIPSETKNAKILAYEPQVGEQEPKFVLYKDNGFKLYNVKTKQVDEIVLTDDARNYSLDLNDNETEIQGIISRFDESSSYYSYQLKKNLYEGEYENFSVLDGDYVEGFKMNDEENSDDDESYLLSNNEEKVIMKSTGACKSYRTAIYGEKMYIYELDGCTGGSTTTIYTGSKALIAKDKNSTEWDVDEKGNLYILSNNKVEKYNIDGKLLSTSKSYSNILHVIRGFILYKENNNIYITDGKTTTKIGPWEDKFYYHSMLSGYYDEGSLANEHEKEAGIYLIFEYGQMDEEPGVEYYFNTETKEVKKFDLDYIGGYAKPVLYLYPEETTEVTINFEHEDNLTTTYPKFKDEWKVTAHPNGDLYDEKGNYYYGLYWEEDSNHKVDFKEGFYVSKDNAISFLEEKLSIIGLNDKERNEFIMYWLPILEKNEQSLVYFELTEERDSFNKLEISPKPDSLLRIAIHVKKVDKKTNIKEQKLTTFKRKGFTAVEWGGIVY